MAIFKCKMCGGTLEVTEGMTVASASTVVPNRRFPLQTMTVVQIFITEPII